MTRVDDAALQRLGAFLTGDRAGENSPTLPWLDGLLTAVAIGPELLLPSEWLPVVWGEDDPEFADADEAQDIIGAIMLRYNQILSQLDSGPGEWSPLIWETPDGMIPVADWAEGFLDGVRLSGDAWMPLLDDDDGHIFFSAIAAFCHNEEGGNLMGLSPESEQRLLEKGPAFLPDCVMAIHAFWRERGAPGPTPPIRRAAKTGRNDPCPCGSGKKYKRCCGTH